MMQSFEQYFQEMALTDLQKIGKWDNSKNRHGYDKASVGILNSEKGLQKIKDVFNKVDADFNLYFVKQPNAHKYSEIGEVNPNKLKTYLGLQQGVDFPNPPEDSITVFFTNNKAADRTPLTPWTIAHRIGHAFQATARNNYKQQQNIELNELYKTISEIFSVLYNIDLDHGDLFSPYFNNNNYNTTRNFLESIGTFRSARLKKLNRPFEFVYECFAQYLLTGKIKFNDFPNTINSSNKKAWGKETGRIYRKNNDPIAEEEYKTRLEHDLMRLFDFWIGIHYNTLNIM